MKKGFTLLELIVVTIIMGILATLGFISYLKTIERARGIEAKMVLGNLRGAEEAYYLEHEAYASNIIDLAVNAPAACSTTHFFSYRAEGVTQGDGIGIALRCTTSGKNPNADAYSINVTWSSGVWGGSKGYY